jgi:hypothetical protein
MLLVMVDLLTWRSVVPLVNGGKYSSSKVKELSIANQAKSWKSPVAEMARTCLFNITQGTVPTRSSPSSMLITPRLIENTLKVS